MFEWLKQVLFATARRNARQDVTRQPTAHASLIAPSESHKTRGDECLAAGAADAATDHYRRALAIDPGFAQAHAALGDALRESRDFGAAALSYRKALELDDSLAQAHYGLGVTLLERSDFQNATVYFRNALARAPQYTKAHNALGFALLEQGDKSNALACFRDTLRIDPNDGMARHVAASLSGDNPERAPAQYVEKLFDGYAQTFDVQLQQLGYDTPQQLSALIARHRTASASSWDVLDLGCGTGLVGQAMAPHTRYLAGVDMSAKMLEKARERNLYHQLHHGDMLAQMQNEPAARYDVIVAADTFIYCGKLDEIAHEAQRLLRQNGLFAFSVEALEIQANGQPATATMQDYCLQAAPSCRYAHASPYLLRLAQEHGFRVCHMATAPIRNSGGRPVSGYLVLMEKP